MDTLQQKRLEAQVPDPSAMEECDALPDLVNASIAEEVAEKVTQQLTGSTGPGGWIRLLSNSGCFVLVEPASNLARLWRRAQVGWQMNNQSGPGAELFNHHDAWRWTRDQGKESLQQEPHLSLQGSKPSASRLSAETKPRMRKKSHHVKIGQNDAARKGQFLLQPTCALSATITAI